MLTSLMQILILRAGLPGAMGGGGWFDLVSGVRGSIRTEVGNFIIVKKKHHLRFWTKAVCSAYDVACTSMHNNV